MACSYAVSVSKVSALGAWRSPAAGHGGPRSSIYSVHEAIDDSKQMRCKASREPPESGRQASAAVRNFYNRDAAFL